MILTTSKCSFLVFHLRNIYGAPTMCQEWHFFFLLFPVYTASSKLWRDLASQCTIKMFGLCLVCVCFRIFPSLLYTLHQLYFIILYYILYTKVFYTQSIYWMRNMCLSLCKKLTAHPAKMVLPSSFLWFSEENPQPNSKLKSFCVKFYYNREYHVVLKSKKK